MGSFNDVTTSQYSGSKTTKVHAPRARYDRAILTGESELIDRRRNSIVHSSPLGEVFIEGKSSLKTSYRLL
jgi:hypothetical protein